jgi:hypothetical protein
MRNAVVALGLGLWGAVACGDDETPPVMAQGGEEDGRGGVPVAVAGQGGISEVGGEGPGGASPCNDGLQPLQVIADGDLELPSGSAIAVLGWPDTNRVAVSMGRAIALFDIADASDGSVRLVELLTAEDAGLSEMTSLGDLHQDGDGLIVFAQDESEGMVFLSWQPDVGFVTLTSVPEELLFLTGQIADPEHGIVVAARETLHRAQRVGDDWSWSLLGSVTGRRLVPLAFDGDELLIGIEEIPRFLQGEGGAGGAGGAPDAGAGGMNGDIGHRSPGAYIERWSLQGERLASYETVGDPAVAIPARGGWLIGETNSFWGSYRAAVEWLDSSGTLTSLTPVAVRSSTDGIDGAHDVALNGEDLFVANCESGLKQARWGQGETSVELSDVLGPWTPESADCNPRHIEVVGDVFVLAGDRLHFARNCE